MTDYPPQTEARRVYKKRYIEAVEVVYMEVEWDGTEEIAMNNPDNKTADSTEETGDTILESYEVEEPLDPLEDLNRRVFWLNDRLYFYLIKPIARGYSFVIPEDFRVAVRNLFHNLTTPVRMVNSLLQGKVDGAARELLRFLLNTTAGVAGLADPATEFGLKSEEEDFGQTLAVYGMREGPYLVLPVLGPSNLRDFFGLVVDTFIDPVNYISDLQTVLAIQSYRYLNNTSLRIGEYETLKASALDPYTALKDAYHQNRRKEVQR